MDSDPAIMTTARDKEITRRLDAMSADEKEELQYKAAGKLGLANFMEFAMGPAIHDEMRRIVGEQIDIEAHS